MPRPSRIRVLVVDGHEMVRLGLAACLNDVPDMRVVGLAGRAEEALALCSLERPDVVLLDLGLPSADGQRLLVRMRDRGPEAQVIGRAGVSEQELIPKALLGGAVNCLLKSVSARELAEAVRDAATRRTMISGTAAQMLIALLDRVGRQEVSLTVRQKQVLQLGARVDQPANRASPGHSPGHCAHACRPHPAQIRRRQPDGGGHAGLSTRLGPSELNPIGPAASARTASPDRCVSGATLLG